MLEKPHMMEEILVIDCLHCSRTFDKQLKVMKRSGKKAEWAANQCEKILEDIRKKGVFADEVYRKRTKNGECRISNCVKYDLGNGYRLITVRVANHLFVPFVGTHDETDQWLARHKQYEFKSGDPAYRQENVSFHDENRMPSGQVEREQEQLPDPYEEQLLERVDEALLKMVFKGLYRPG